MVHVDLFSGTGGFALACQWAGIPTICFVENDQYCQKVLRKHWPDVAIVEDIRDVGKIKEIVANASVNGRTRSGIAWNRGHGLTDISSISKQCWWQGKHSDCQEIWCNCACHDDKPTILITAGFPCQPFSNAGKREGEGDDRYLWPETIAVIEAIKPEWVLLENVTGIINLALDTVLSDLEGAGYSYETLIIPACAINAPHRRDRVWIVAHSKSNGNARGPAKVRRPKRRQGYSLSLESDKPSPMANSIGTEGGGEPGRLTSRAQDKGRGATEEGGETIRPRTEAPLPGQSRQAGDIVPDAKSRESRQQTEQERGEGSSRGSEEVAIANTQREGLEGPDTEGDICRTGQPSEYRQGGWQADWWAVEPDVGRVAHGIPNRVDRLKCLGNAIVPQVAYEIIKVIKERMRQ